MEFDPVSEPRARKSERKPSMKSFERNSRQSGNRRRLVCCTTAASLAAYTCGVELPRSRRGAVPPRARGSVSRKPPWPEGGVNSGDAFRPLILGNAEINADGRELPGDFRLADRSGCFGKERCFGITKVVVWDKNTCEVKLDFKNLRRVINN